MKLSEVIEGRIDAPMRLLVYGVEGVGKSTFAAGAPKPVFVGELGGTRRLKVARFREPRTWQNLFEAIEELTTGEHSYQTAVFDTLDWFEPMAWAYVLESARDKLGRPYKTIEDVGYGKGYIAALIHWRSFLKRLDQLRDERGMHVVLLAHSWIRTFKNPEGEDFDRYEMKLDKRASGVLREECDAVMFATHETLTYEGNGRQKGISSGARLLYTTRRAAWDAKNRYDLPEALPLDWSAFMSAVEAGEPDDPDRLKQQIATLLESAPSTVNRDAVKKVTTAAGDNAAELARILNKLSARVSIATAKETQPNE